MFDPMLGLVTVGPLCRGYMVGVLAGVMVLRMGTRRCSPIQNVWVGERLVFVVFATTLYVFILMQRARWVGSALRPCLKYHQRWTTVKKKVGDWHFLNSSSTEFDFKLQKVLSNIGYSACLTICITVQKKSTCSFFKQFLKQFTRDDTTALV